MKIRLGTDHNDLTSSEKSLGTPLRGELFLNARSFEGNNYFMNLAKNGLVDSRDLIVRTLTIKNHCCR